MKSNGAKLADLRFLCILCFYDDDRREWIQLDFQLTEDQVASKALHCLEFGAIEAHFDLDNQNVILASENVLLYHISYGFKGGGPNQPFSLGCQLGSQAEDHVLKVIAVPFIIRVVREKMKC